MDSIKRIPNRYVTDVLNIVKDSSKIPAVLENQEFAQFLTGQRNEISQETAQRIKDAMQSQNAKINLFFAAYAQKGMSRLARLMQVLDTVDTELFQAWRVNIMSNAELMDLLGELNTDRHATVKELIEISNKFDGEKPSKNLMNDSDKEQKEINSLTPSSKKKIIDFLKKRVVKNDSTAPPS
jgi:hypothetical protein